MMVAEILEGSRRTIAACDFTVYGLDGCWTGSRWIGGSSSSNGVLDGLTLAFGDQTGDERPHVRATTYRPSPSNRDLSIVSRSLVQQYWHGGAAHGEAMRSTFQHPENPTKLWDDLELSVDGQPAAWKALGDAGNWVALAVLDGVVVSVHARAIDAREVRFTRVDDFEPYLVEVPLPG